jgi:hypothetical protein
MPPLNDVWLNLNEELGVYFKGRFDRVPASPGVYAWFYPLRITSFDLNVFLEDVGKVFTFDARINGPARLSFTDRICWEEVRLDMAINPANPPMPGAELEVWKRVTANPEDFDRLRRVVMKGSLLMPPIYVGKARELNVRCQQHLAGSSQFSQRFTAFAAQSGLAISRMEDLLFACIKTSSDEGANDDSALEGILEEILKRVCRPRYSVK